MSLGRSIRLTKRGRHVLKRGIRLRSDRLNGGQAHDHDQRQHNGVFDRGGTVFRDEETLYLHSKILHSILRFSGRLLGKFAGESKPYYVREPL